MGEKILKWPDRRSIGLYSGGFLVGLVAPGLLTAIMNTIADSGLASGFIGSKLNQMANEGVTSNGAAQSIIYALLLVVAVVAADKVTAIGKLFIMGVATGIIFRVVIIYVFGIGLPTSPAVGYDTPMNETSNMTNGSVQGW